ncbi:hypothetical protein B0H11DRAFT_2235293 [Mycena galericulata]|nr:hypothetical protein B0H11DRAFT_2235293 [Mycena galericulata]
MSSGLLVVLHLLALQAGRSGSLSVFRAHSRYDSWLMRRVAQQIQTEAPASVAPAPALSRAFDIPSVSACTSHVTLRELPRSVVAAQALHLPTHCASNASKRSHGPRPRAPPLRPSSASRFSSPHSKSPRMQPTQTLGSTSPLPRRRLHIRLTVIVLVILSASRRLQLRRVCARLSWTLRPGCISTRTPALARTIHAPHQYLQPPSALRPPPFPVVRFRFRIPFLVIFGSPCTSASSIRTLTVLLPPLPIFTLPVHTTPSAPSASPSASA